MTRFLQRLRDQAVDLWLGNKPEPQQPQKEPSSIPPAPTPQEIAELTALGPVPIGGEA